jgi:hypothetical protein
MRNVLGKGCFYETHAVYEIMSKNMAEPERPEMTVKCGACALHD